jgi:hypothetical protein
MAHMLFAIAVVGFGIGVAFRLKVLLLIVALLLIFSAALAVSQGLDLQQTILVVIVWQSIVQAAYFLGTLFRSLVEHARRTPIL